VNRARPLAAVAVALAALGLLARSGGVLPPGLTATLATYGRAATPVAAVALAAGTAVGAAALVRGRRAEPVDPAGDFRARAAPTDDLPLLGAEVAAALDRVAREGPGADPADRETVRAAVERAGVTVIARADGVDRETARARFRRGDWTRDPTVAAFCGDTEVDLRTRLVEALAPEPRFARRARRTVVALADVADGAAGAETADTAAAERGGDRR
jgi:hypothetical protein